MKCRCVDAARLEGCNSDVIETLSSVARLLADGDTDSDAFSDNADFGEFENANDAEDNRNKAKGRVV